MVQSTSFLSRAASKATHTVADEWRETRVATVELWHWARAHNWRRTAKTVFRRKYWGWWFAIALTTALSAVLSSYHKQIVAGISPYKHAIRKAPWSWIPVIVILVIISFPPLFGHELVILAVGIIWGIGRGFAIACGGTFLGELACFYAFRYYLTDRARKIELKHVAYSCLAKMMREGGVGIIILVRFSAVPGHVTTAIQSTVGMSVWIYGIAAAFSLPKQFVLVYLGVVFGSTSLTLDQWRMKHPDEVSLAGYYSGTGSEGKRHRISLIVFAATTVATLIAGWIVWMRIRRIRPIVLAEMEARRVEEALEGAPTKTKEELEMLELANEEGVVQTPGDQSAPPAVLRRPAFNFRDSSESLSSRTELLVPGRGRSDTGSTQWSGLSSPSMPHLPRPPSDEEMEYFDLASPERSRSRGESIGRRGSF